MDEAEQNLISGRHCPECGYNLTGHPIADEVRCPECGRVSEYAKLSIGPPPGVVGRVFNLINENGRSKILGVALLLIVAGLLISLLRPYNSAHRDYGQESYAVVRLRQISSDMNVYCHDWDNQWPPNPGVLVANGYSHASDFIDYGAAAGMQNRTFAGIDLESFDLSRPQDVAALLAAANAADTSEQHYRFGDVWLTRLPAPSVISASALGGDLIQAWALPNDDGSHAMLFADGHIETIRPANWAGVWAADAKARQSLGIAPIDPPPPVDE